MRHSSVIALLAVSCFALSLTVAYLVGYQRGGQAKLSAPRSDGPAIRVGKRGTAGPVDAPTTGQRSTFGMRVRPSGQPRATPSTVEVREEVHEATAEVISRFARGTEPAGQAVSVPRLEVWVAEGAESLILFETNPLTDNLVRIEGTSTLYAWEASSRVVVGRFQPGRDFPPVRRVPRSGRAKSRGDFTIPVKSLHLVQKDGSRLGKEMDSIMYKMLEVEDHGRIEFTLSELTMTNTTKLPPNYPVLPFESRGKLRVAGVEKEVLVPLALEIDGENIRFYGELNVKLSDFKIEPPSWSIPGGTLNKAGDNVKLSVSWAVRRVR